MTNNTTNAVNAADLTGAVQWLTGAKIALDGAREAMARARIFHDGAAYRAEAALVETFEGNVREAQAEVDRILAIRAAAHIAGAVAPEDETTADTLCRWAWEDLND
jgi:hypothetical protein